MTKEQIAEATWKWLADDGRNVDMLVNRIYALQSESDSTYRRLVDALKKCEYLLPDSQGRALLIELGEIPSPADTIERMDEALRASQSEAEGPVVAWKFRMDGVDQVMLDEDADIHIRRNGTPLYERQSAPLRPPKPQECEVACPPQQVCDHCQWTPSPQGDEKP